MPAQHGEPRHPAHFAPAGRVGIAAPNAKVALAVRRSVPPGNSPPLRHFVPDLPLLPHGGLGGWGDFAVFALAIAPVDS